LLLLEKQTCREFRRIMDMRILILSNSKYDRER
jgi:hypothetical protein